MTDQRNDSIQVTLVSSEFLWGCLQGLQGGLWATSRWLHVGRAPSQILTVHGPPELPHTPLSLRGCWWACSRECFICIITDVLVSRP